MVSSLAQAVRVHRANRGWMSVTLGQIDSNEPEIMQRMRRELRLHHKAMRTERSYLGWVRRFIRHCGSAIWNADGYG